MLAAWKTVQKTLCIVTQFLLENSFSSYLLTHSELIGSHFLGTSFPLEQVQEVQLHWMRVQIWMQTD